MPYRSQKIASAEREALLERELQSLRGPRAVTELHADRIAALEAELSRVRANAPPEPRARIRVRTALPCLESWHAMSGADRVRRCSRCKRHVYDLSELSSDEAGALLVATEGSLPQRLYRRWDGSVATKDCRRERRRRTLLGAAAAIGLVPAIGYGLDSASAAAPSSACFGPAHSQMSVERAPAPPEPRLHRFEEIPVDLVRITDDQKKWIPADLASEHEAPRGRKRSRTSE